MYHVSSEFNTAAEANTRRILIKALFNDSVWLTGENLISGTVTEAVAASGGLSMGTTISSKLSLTFKMPDDSISLSGGWVKLYTGFYGIDDYCPLGTFYITEVESKGEVFTITAYDGFSKTENKYSPSITMPNTAAAILADISSQCGFSFSQTYVNDFGCLTLSDSPSVDEQGVLIFATTPVVDENGVLVLSDDSMQLPEGEFDLYDFTCREYIGYFAGLLGKNAKFNRAGNLTFSWYTTTDAYIPKETQYLGGFKRLTDRDFTVQSISSGNGDNIIVSGSGVGISFENPFMTQERLDNIAAEIGTPTFTPATVKWRGNPSIEAGDIIAVEDNAGEPHQFYVMEQIIRIGGGLFSEVKCFGKSDEEIQFDTSPTSKKLEQVYTKLQDAIKEATTLLNGANGGVFEVVDENGDGTNDGWIIHSLDNRQFIKANLNGIGITTDGGATYQQAITPAGINASSINTGSLNAERIAVENYDEADPTKLTDYIRFGDGTITLGKGDSAIILKLENNQVAFYNTAGIRLGRFTNNSFEIDNLENGQIRFQNFGFIPRASKNLTFTKLT
jgi:hypothetical protein